MPVYREKTIVNGKQINKTVDGKQQWFIRTYVDGRQITKRNKKWLGKEGYDLALEQEIKLKKGIIQPSLANIEKNVYFKDFINLYKQEIVKTTKESSYCSYFNVIKNQITPHFSETLKASNLNIEVLKKWHEKLEAKKLSIEYLNKCHHIMKAILNVGVKYFQLKTNYEAILGPFKSNKSKILTDEEKLRYITYDEFCSFISPIEEPLWKAFFIFLYYTGMRKGEIQALSWKDIDFENNEIKVDKTLNTKIDKENNENATSENESIKYKITTTKNNLNRKIKMSKILRETLLDFKKHEMLEDNFNEDWFLFGRIRFLPDTTINRKKHYYFKLSNVKEITIHEFRHSHVSLLINEYIKTGQTDTAKFFLMMSNRMGHTIKVMQETYMHLFPTIQDEIVSILDNLI